MLTSIEILKQVVSGNNSFCDDHDGAYFKNHQNTQTPVITLVSCSDSRVDSQALLPDGINQIFCVRNIGNQISGNEGSVDYGVYHLKTPLLIILGHSDCGAIKAYYGGYDDEPASIQRELNKLSPVYINAKDETDPVKKIMKNLNYQVQVALTKYAELVKDGSLTVVGAYYDFADDLGKGHGKLNIISINGTKQ